MIAPATRPLMPFVVGAPRSGTTLLRLMLDAHPQLAIPPETGFLVKIADWVRHPPTSAEQWLDEVMRFPVNGSAWPDFGLEPRDVLAAMDSGRPFDVAAGIRSFYQAVDDARLRAALDVLRRGSERSQAEASEARQAREAIQDSTTWRLFAPYRRLRSRLKR